MVISSLFGQQNLVQEMKQNGMIVHLFSIVTMRVVMPAYQTKILQNYWSFVIHFKLYPSKKVNIYIYIEKEKNNKLHTEKTTLYISDTSLIFVV